MELADILSEYLMKSGLTHRAFSERTKRNGMKGISAGYVSMIINGKNPQTGKPMKPNIDTLSSIANGMNITLHELMSMMDQDYVVSINGEENPPVDSDEGQEYLQYLRDREELRTLFEVSKTASRADIERAIAIIESLKSID